MSTTEIQQVAPTRRGLKASTFSVNPWGSRQHLSNPTTPNTKDTSTSRHPSGPGDVKLMPARRTQSSSKARRSVLHISMASVRRERERGRLQWMGRTVGVARVTRMTCKWSGAGVIQCLTIVWFVRCIFASLVRLWTCCRTNLFPRYYRSFHLVICSYSKRHAKPSTNSSSPMHCGEKST